MPNITGTTRVQSNFLRALRDNPHLPPEQWPTPFLFRKWLRRPAFRRALLSLRAADRFRSAHHLSQSASRASLLLHGHILGAEGFELEPDQLSLLSKLLRLSHSAERLDPLPDPRPAKLTTDASDITSLASTHPAVSPAAGHQTPTP